MLFHQCRLEQGEARLVAWIEARGARPGALVEIPDAGGIWRVATVCPIPIEARQLYEKQRIDHRGMPSG